MTLVERMKDYVYWLSDGYELVQEAVVEIVRLRAVIERLGSNEAFDLPTSNVSREEKMRMDFARKALIDD